MAIDDLQIPSGGGPLVFVADLERPELDDEDDHHLRRVRRVREGDPLVIGDGGGSWRTATLRASVVEPDGPIHTLTRPTPAIGVAFALVKGSKPELIVQKLTELGVDQIGLFTAARSVVRWDEAKARSADGRLRRIAREAAMQSRRPWLPEVAPLGTFAEMARRSGSALADRGGAAPSLVNPFVLVGPEGGWDDKESALDRPRVALASTVLRAETAAIVAGSLLVALRSGIVRQA